MERTWHRLRAGFSLLSSLPAARGGEEVGPLPHWSSSLGLGQGPCQCWSQWGALWPSQSWDPPLQLRWYYSLFRSSGYLGAQREGLQ